MKVTTRRMDFFQLLQGARWLTTSQVQRRLFAQATMDAVRKWLRSGVETRHLIEYRENWTNEKLFTLGPEGKRVLEQAGGAEIRLERKPPKQIEHLSGINDIRIAAELTGAVSYFFACWELPALGWQHPVIPDALIEIAGQTFAVEFDRGLEGLKYFLRTKISAYEVGFDGFPLAAVVVITDRKARMDSLARVVAGAGRPILFSTLEQVRTQGLAAPIFHRWTDDEASPLI